MCPELLSNLGYLKDSGLPNYVAGFEAQGHFYLATRPISRWTSLSLTFGETNLPAIKAALAAI